MLPKNIGVRDRDIRIGLVGPLAVLALFFLHGVWAIAVGAIALILLITAALGFCPLYLLRDAIFGAKRAAASAENPTSHRH